MGVFFFSRPSHPGVGLGGRRPQWDAQYQWLVTYYDIWWKNSCIMSMGTSSYKGLNNIPLVVSGISEASAVENDIGGIDIQLWNCQAADRTAKLSWLIRSWYNRSHYVLSHWSCSVSHWLEFFGKTAHHDNCWIVMNYSHWCIDANQYLGLNKLAARIYMSSIQQAITTYPTVPRQLETPLVSGRREAGNRTWDPKRL